MPLFQQTAQRAADLFLQRLTPDWVPLWDFDAPPNQVRLGLRTVVGGWAGLDKFAVASHEQVATCRWPVEVQEQLRRRHAQQYCPLLPTLLNPGQPTTCTRWV